MPCQKTNAPATDSSSASGTSSLAKPPMKAPPTAGTPMASAIRTSTRPSRRWRTDPVRALRPLIRMLVPPAVGAATPIRSRAGNRIVPSARPTNPPRTPTPRDTTVRTTACHTSTSEASPSSVCGSVIQCRQDLRRSGAVAAYGSSLLHLGRQTLHRQTHLVNLLSRRRMIAIAGSHKRRR